ncbi:MAG TPA: hypothetical protein VFA81_08255 [Burkholderiales bacterium]|nr:hypothetical protein [Burkholderiales bacterium]
MIASWRLCLALLALLAPWPAATADDEANAAEAVSRVVASHDTTLLLGGGALMIKQSAIRSARKLLGEWGREAGLRGEWWDSAPEYRAAKQALLADADGIMAKRYLSGAWLRQAWTEYASRELDGEEADTVATHFQTEGGQKLRQLMDWYLGEMVLFNYTFTDRFDYELQEAEHELRALQQEAQKRIPREDIEFTSRYPDTFQFVACSPDSRYCPSLKYWKMLIYPLMGEIIRYIDGVSAEIESTMRKRKPQVDAYIAEFKARAR